MKIRKAETFLVTFLRYFISLSSQNSKEQLVKKVVNQWKNNVDSEYNS